MAAEPAPAPEGEPDERFQRAPFGYLETTPDWTIVEVNRTLLDLLGLERSEVVGHRFPSLLAVGDRIYHETYLGPLVTLQGHVKEVAVELLGRDGRRWPALVNAATGADPTGASKLIRVGVIDVSDRRHYERELLAARERAETSEARERALQIVIADLAVAVTARDVERAVADFLHETLQTTGGTLWLLGNDGRTLHRRGDAAPPLQPTPAPASGAATDGVAAHAERPIDGGEPATDPDEDDPLRRPWWPAR